MINGLKVKQWGFKFGTSKENTKPPKNSVSGKIGVEKKLYQREVVNVNLSPSAKATVVHEIKIKTEGAEQDKVKCKTFENGACVKDIAKHEHGETVKHDTKLRDKTDIAVKGISLANGNVKHEETKDRHKSHFRDSKDIHVGSGDVCLGKVKDKTEADVESDLSDDDDCLSDSHGINICHYKLK